MVKEHLEMVAYTVLCRQTNKLWISKWPNFLPVRRRRRSAATTPPTMNRVGADPQTGAGARRSGEAPAVAGKEAGVQVGLDEVIYGWVIADTFWHSSTIALSIATL